MIRVHPGAVALSLLTAVMGQTPRLTSLTPTQQAYFVRFFGGIGSPDLPQAILDARRAGIQSQLLLSADEAAALAVSADAYRSQMTDIRSREKAVLSGKKGLSDGDRALITSLIQERDALVTKMALQFLSHAQAVTMNRLFVDAEAGNSRKPVK